MKLLSRLMLYVGYSMLGMVLSNSVYAARVVMSTITNNTQIPIQLLSNQSHVLGIVPALQRTQLNVELPCIITDSTWHCIARLVQQQANLEQAVHELPLIARLQVMYERSHRNTQLGNISVMVCKPVQNNNYNPLNQTRYTLLAHWKTGFTTLPPDNTAEYQIDLTLLANQEGALDNAPLQVTRIGNQE